MSYLDKLDPDGTKRKEGYVVEDMFINLLKSKGFEVLDYDKKKDIYEHKDIQFIHDGQVRSCDVKSPKRLRHSDGEYLNGTWLEAVGPTGHPGWIYGKEDFVAFLKPDYKTFLCATLEDLQHLWESKNITNRTYMIETAWGNWYRRKNTKEKISLFTYDEIEQLPHTVKMVV